MSPLVRFEITAVTEPFVPRRQVVHRHGANAGDAIFVTGELGGSLAGKHLDFTPRIAEARWLATNYRITSMIDLSDGLASDLRDFDSVHFAHCRGALTAPRNIHRTFTPFAASMATRNRTLKFASPPPSLAAKII